MEKSDTIIASLALAALLWAPMSATGEEDRRQNAPAGERFHRETSLARRGAPKPMELKKDKRPEVIRLPKPERRGMSVEEAISRRRSIRDYSKKPVTLVQLSQLLFAAQGITGKSFGYHYRAAPSAGALYPFEMYVFVNNVEDLAQGLYHYAVMDHSLELLEKGDFSKRLADAGLGQEALEEAAAVFAMSAVFGRTKIKYGERGYRYVYIEAGHISQNIYLESVSLGLGSVAMGAFIDEEVNSMTGLDGVKEAVIYLHAVGSL